MELKGMKLGVEVHRCDECEYYNISLFMENEIKQWKEEANRYQNLWCEAVKDMESAKTDAIKEFAERLKEQVYIDGHCELVINEMSIDHILAEMVGDKYV